MRSLQIATGGIALLGLASTIALINSQGRAVAAKPDGAKFSCSSTSACLTATSTGNANGLQATSAKSTGVAGSITSNNGTGVFGSSTAVASGFGVAGRTLGGGFSYGVYADGGGQTADAMSLQTVTDATYNMIEITNFAAGLRTLTLDTKGNLSISGLLYTNLNCSSGCAKPKGHTLAYGLSESEPTIEDQGEARLHDGGAHVSLSRAFAETIDTRAQYVVLLSPEGDAGTLFVARRTRAGFDVLEAHGGRTSIPFAYRIIARPLGSAARRLPFVNDLAIGKH
jgi:hypothetical protein